MNLTREALLQAAQEKSWTSKAIFDMAKLSTSVASLSAFKAKVEAKQRVIEKALKRWEIVMAVSIFGSIIYGLALLAGIPLGFYESSFWKEISKSVWGLVILTVWVYAIVPMLVGVARSSALDRKNKQLVFELSEMQPIRGTNACQEALQYVETGYKEVLAWRDLAIAERGQLYGFDVAVMGELHRVARKRQEQAEAQVRNDAACKAVHGIGANGSNDYVAV